MMKKTVLFTGLVLGAAASAPPAHAQASIGPAVINAAGGSATIGGNTHEYSIGTVPTLPTYISGSLVVTGGALQPQWTTGIANRLPALTSVEIFPNPTSTVLHIAPALGGRGLLEMHLLDATGKTVRRATATLLTGTERQTLDMQPFAACTYLLTLVWTPEDRSAQAAGSSTYTVQKLR